MSLAKYVDLVCSRTVYFPKASLFPDETEGKWLSHAYLWGQKRHWEKAKANADTLHQLLVRATSDPGRILQQAALLYGTMTEIEKKGVLGDVLAGVLRVHPGKREGYVKGLVESWTKYHDGFNSEVREFASQVAIRRESTYISCWSRADSMSAAMWNMYGGTEAVAIRSSAAKLKALLASNLDWLANLGLSGEVVDVHYANGLMEPDEDLQNDLLERLSIGNDVCVGEFSIKPSLYEYEREVRAVLYPKRALSDPLVDPHPDLSGISLPIEGREGEAQMAIRGFIDSAHVHPMLGSESMMVRVLQAINVRFGLPDVPIVADKIEAIGPNVSVQPG